MLSNRQNHMVMVMFILFYIQVVFLANGMIFLCFMYCDLSFLTYLVY